MASEARTMGGETVFSARGVSRLPLTGEQPNLVGARYADDTVQHAGRAPRVGTWRSNVAALDHMPAHKPNIVHHQASWPVTEQQRKEQLLDSPWSVFERPRASGCAQDAGNAQHHWAASQQPNLDQQPGGQLLTCHWAATTRPTAKSNPLARACRSSFDPVTHGGGAPVGPVGDYNHSTFEAGVQAHLVQGKNPLSRAQRSSFNTRTPGGGALQKPVADGNRSTFMAGVQAHMVHKTRSLHVPKDLRQQARAGASQRVGGRAHVEIANWPAAFGGTPMLLLWSGSRPPGAREHDAWVNDIHSTGMKELTCKHTVFPCVGPYCTSCYFFILQEDDEEQVDTEANREQQEKQVGPTSELVSRRRGRGTWGRRFLDIMPKSFGKTKGAAASVPSFVDDQGGQSLKILRQRTQQRHEEVKRAMAQQAKEVKDTGQAAGLAQAKQQMAAGQEKKQLQQQRAEQEKQEKASELREITAHTDRLQAAERSADSVTQEMGRAIQEILEFRGELHVATGIGTQVLGRAILGWQDMEKYRSTVATTKGKDVIWVDAPDDDPSGVTAASLQQFFGDHGLQTTVTVPAEQVWPVKPLGPGGVTPAGVAGGKWHPTLVNPRRVVVHPGGDERSAFLITRAPEGIFCVNDVSLNWTKDPRQELVAELAIDHDAKNRQQLRGLLSVWSVLKLNTAKREGFLLSAVKDGMASHADEEIRNLAGSVLAVVMERTKMKKAGESWQWYKPWREAVTFDEGAPRIYLVVESAETKKLLADKCPVITLTLIGVNAAEGGILRVVANITASRRENAAATELLEAGRAGAVQRATDAANSVCMRPFLFLEHATEITTAFAHGKDIMTEAAMLHVLQTELQAHRWHPKHAAIYEAWAAEKLSPMTLDISTIDEDIQQLDQQLRDAPPAGFRLYEIKRAHPDSTNLVRALGQGVRTVGKKMDAAILGKLLDVGLPALGASPVITRNKAPPHTREWDDKKNPLFVAMPLEAEQLLQDKYGDHLPNGYRKIEQVMAGSRGAGTTKLLCLIRQVDDSHNKMDTEKVKERIWEWFQMGYVLRCPKLYGDEGVEWKTKLSDFRAAGLVAPPGSHDIRQAQGLFDLTEEEADAVLERIQDLTNERRVTAAVGSETDEAYCYVAREIAEIISVDNPDFDWTESDDQQLAENILAELDNNFLRALLAASELGIWEVEEADPIQAADGNNGLNENYGMRSWATVLARHPSVTFLQQRHAKGTIAHAHQSGVLVKLEKDNGLLLVAADSPFLELLKEATPMQGVRKNEYIDYDRLPFTDVDVELLRPVLLEAAACNGAHVWIRKNEDGNIDTCTMQRQAHVLLDQDIKTFLREARGRNSNIAFQTLWRLVQNGQAAVFDRGEYYLVVVAPRPATMPLRVPDAKFSDVFQKIKAPVANRRETAITKHVLTIQHPEEVQKALFDDMHSRFLEKWGAAVTETGDAMVLGGWTGTNLGKPSRDWKLTIGAEGLPNLPADIDLERVVNHPLLFDMTVLMETVVPEDRPSDWCVICNVQGGLLVVPPDHPLREFDLHVEGVASWDPVLQSIEDLIATLQCEQQQVSGSEQSPHQAQKLGSGATGKTSAAPPQQGPQGKQAAGADMEVEDAVIVPRSDDE